jgi:peptidoglycan hydrolase-like amidase
VHVLRRDRKRWSYLACCIVALLPLPTLHAQLTEPATVRISVLSLFHPKTLTLTSIHPLTLTLDAQTLILPPNTPATLVSTRDALTLIAPDIPPITTQSVITTQSDFTLTVPNKLTRLYRAALTLTSAAGTLQPTLEIPTELAVASIVQAEAPPHAPLEALKAQAIVSRSFLLANLHALRSFDACDTTHCQFLRSPPPARSPAALATRATRNQVLTWHPTPESLPQIIAAMYSRSCGGHTRPHPTTRGAYPFYAVRCDYCLRHPERWSRLSPAHPPSTEAERLAYNRVHGWSAIPSTTYTADTGARSTTLTGLGTGHSIGLCQLGAADLASKGNAAAQILTQYFPNTTIFRLP